MVFSVITLPEEEHNMCNLFVTNRSLMLVEHHKQANNIVCVSKHCVPPTWTALPSTTPNLCFLLSYLISFEVILVIIHWKHKSNQITFIVTSPQHKCLGEWNSYERAPDSAKKQQTIYIWTDSAEKLHWSIYSAPDSAKKKKYIFFTYGQYIFTYLQMQNEMKHIHFVHIWYTSCSNVFGQ